MLRVPNALQLLSRSASKCPYLLSVSDQTITHFNLVADGVPTIRALENLLMGANGFKGAEAGKALGDAIATNTVLKQLDISGGEYSRQQCDVEFVREFSVGLGANGALTSLNVSNNFIGFEGDMSGVKALAAAIAECR